jgi:hypothetical protein
MVIVDFMMSSYIGITMCKIGSTNCVLITSIFSRIPSQCDREPVKFFQKHHVITSLIASQS